MDGSIIECVFENQTAGFIASLDGMIFERLECEPKSPNDRCSLSGKAMTFVVERNQQRKELNKRSMLSVQAIGQQGQLTSIRL